MKRFLAGGKKGKQLQRPRSWSSDSRTTLSQDSEGPLPIPPPAGVGGSAPVTSNRSDAGSPTSSIDHGEEVLNRSTSMNEAPPMSVDGPAQKPPKPAKRRWFSFRPARGAPLPRSETSSMTSDRSSMLGPHEIHAGQMKPPSIQPTVPGGDAPSIAPGMSDAGRGYASMDTMHRPPSLQRMETMNKPKKKRFGFFSIDFGNKKKKGPPPPTIAEETEPEPSMATGPPLVRSVSAPSTHGTSMEPTTPMPMLDDVVPVARTHSDITRASLRNDPVAPSLHRNPTMKRGGLSRFLSFKKKRPASPIQETPALTRTASLPPSRPATIFDDHHEPMGISEHRAPSIAGSKVTDAKTYMDYPAAGASLHRANTVASARHGRSRAGTVAHTPTAPPAEARQVTVRSPEPVSRHTSVRDRSLPPQPAHRAPYNTPSYAKERLNYSTDKYRPWYHPRQPLSAHPTKSLIEAPIPFEHFMHSNCTGRKRAVCIGINYEGSKYPLKGCINDAEHARDYLISNFGFPHTEVVTLTDRAKNKPTRKIILGALKWLVDGAQPHDSLFIHYSGHGGQAPDPHGDEPDGWDEVIYPLDYRESGYIDDDTLHEFLVKPLPAGCRLTGVFDSCHSGTVLDLPYLYSSTCRQRSSHVSNRSRKRAACPGDVISFSACKDGELSADTFQGGVPVGAMSWALLSVLKRHHDITYKDLLMQTRKVLEPRYSQRPQLGSTYPIDPSRKFVL